MNHIEPYVSILIPTRDNEKDLIECLDSAKRMNYPPDKLEIIIWDNNSRYRAKRKIKNFLVKISNETLIRCQFIEHAGNLGVYTSRDELVRQVSPYAEFILSIDDDVILPPNLLKILLPYFWKDKCIGIIGPKTVYDQAPDETAHGAGFINWWLGRYTDTDAVRKIECDYVIGCCMLIKRAVVDACGGFDRDYYTSHGEVDFCLKARKNGYKTVYCPQATVRHRVERGGTKSLDRRYYIYRNKLIVIKKNAPMPQKWISLAVYFLLWLPKITFDSIIENRGAKFFEIKMIVRAVTDGWLGRVGRRL